jgi:LuxR family maltose regulon positive regulatory protein
LSALIIRKDLLDLLTRSQNYPLTLLVAPAGFGKSTLLDQWQANNKYARIARVNLSHQENTLLVVMYAVLKQIRSVIDVYDASIFNLFDDGIDVNDRLLTDAIYQVFSLIDEPIYLIVDDFKISDINEHSRFLSYLLENLPKNVHFIFSTRFYPDMNLSRLKISDKLLFIDSYDLMADRDQVNDLAKEVCGNSITDTQVDKLVGLTEGWLAGVKIALLAMKEYGAQGLDEFNGTQRDVMEFFGSEVYSSLDGDQKKFYLATSILDKFNAPLCDYLLSINNSESMLDDLIQQSVFIVSEKESGWYRFHSLMGEFLRKRINDYFSPDQVDELYRRAVKGCIKQSDYVMAIQYSSYLATDDERVHLLIACCDYWLKQGEFTHIIKALDDMDEETLLSDSRLYIALAYALIFSRRFNQASYFLEILEKSSLEKDGIAKGDLEFLEISLNLFQRDTDALSQSNVSNLMLSLNESDTRNFSLIISAYYELQNGALSTAMTIAQKAKVILSKKGYVFLESYTDLLIALCDRYMGRGIDAANYIDSINNEKRYPEGSLAWVSLNVAMVVVHYERNELFEARALCDKLLPKLNHSCVTEVISTIYLYLARLMFISGELRKSNRVLDQLNRILILGKYERFASQSVYEVMRQAYICNDEVKAKKMINEQGLNEAEAQLIDMDGVYVESYERRSLALAYGLCLKGRYDESIDLLKVVATQLKNLGIVSREIVVLSNITVFEYLKGQKATAAILLQEILTEYSLLSFSRTMFDEAPGLAKVFMYLEDTTRYEIPDLYRNVFSDVFNSEIEHEATGHFPILSLTAKEMEIYRLLLNGLSNADISKEIGVALSTTKWHLKNIYQKLGVKKRSELITLKNSLKEEA